MPSGRACCVSFQFQEEECCRPRQRPPRVLPPQTTTPKSAAAPDDDPQECCLPSRRPQECCRPRRRPQECCRPRRRPQARGRVLLPQTTTPKLEEKCCRPTRRILFLDFSSAFSTMILPQKLFEKLQQLSVLPSLTPSLGRPQSVKCPDVFVNAALGSYEIGGGSY